MKKSMALLLVSIVGTILMGFSGCTKTVTQPVYYPPVTQTVTHTPTKTPTYVPQSSNLVNGTVTANAGSYYYQAFTVDTSYMTNPTVVGSFTASGGSGNDVIALILDAMSFTNWVNGHQVNTYYNSGQVTVANINAPISTSGTYYLVFSNTFSIISTKHVAATVNLTWSQLEYQ